MIKKISEHITYKEAIHSDTAKRMGIDNSPDEYQLYNLQMVAEFIFEPLRQHFNVPIMISSMFRSVQLNNAIGGVESSQHLYNHNSGAIDLDDTYGHLTNLEILQWIELNLDFDQLINEKPDEFGNPSWVHVSFKANGNRKQSFTLG